MAELNPHITNFFDQVKAQVKEFFLRDGSLNLGMCFMLTGDKIMHIPFPILEGNKDMIATLLKQAASHLKPSALVFVSECWIVQRENTDEVKSQFKNGMSVSEQPDKTECLMLVCETKLISYTSTIPIVRDSSGKPTLGEEFRADNTEGRFSNLLSHPIGGYSKN